VKNNLRFPKNPKRHRRRHQLKSLNRHRLKQKRVRIYFGRELDEQSGSLL
jgi:hypothetical protein